MRYQTPPRRWLNCGKWVPAPVVSSSAAYKYNVMPRAIGGSHSPGSARPRLDLSRIFGIRLSYRHIRVLRRIDRILHRWRHRLRRNTKEECFRLVHTSSLRFRCSMGSDGSLSFLFEREQNSANGTECFDIDWYWFSDRVADHFRLFADESLHTR